jgi:hypothetical protein
METVGRKAGVDVRPTRSYRPLFACARKARWRAPRSALPGDAQGMGSGSRYRDVQLAHGITAGALRPDLVLRHTPQAGERRLMVEVKGGLRPVGQSARVATFGLLVYRTAFASLLAGSERAYGFGIAWVQTLPPSSRAENPPLHAPTLPDAFRELLGHSTSTS